MRRKHVSNPTPRRDYTGSAILTMILYLFLFLPGLIANCAFLSSANKERQRTGVSADGVGCLWALLITFLSVPMLFLLVFLFALGQHH